MATEIAKKLFTVHDYHKMVDAGILREGERVELIRGEVIRMSPINPPHNGTIHRANHFLSRIVGDDAIVGVQGSIRLDEYDEPSPTCTYCAGEKTSTLPGMLGLRTSC